MVLVLNGQACLLHIVQYSAAATVARVVGLGVVGGLDAVVMVVVVIVVGADVSIKVGIEVLDSKKSPSTHLTLFCFLLTWWLTVLLLFFGFLTFLSIGICCIVNGDIMGLSG